MDDSPCGGQLDVGHEGVATLGGALSLRSFGKHM